MYPRPSDFCALGHIIALRELQIQKSVNQGITRKIQDKPAVIRAQLVITARAKHLILSSALPDTTALLLP